MKNIDFPRHRDAQVKKGEEERSVIFEEIIWPARRTDINRGLTDELMSSASLPAGRERKTRTHGVDPSPRTRWLARATDLR